MIMALASTEFLRALECLALSSPPTLNPELIERAKLIAPVLHLIDDGSEEFEALADLIKAIAFKEKVK